MGELLESLARHFSFSHEADREYGIEIDPRFANGDYIRHLGELGFNRIRSEEHTSELQSLMRISYAVFCLKKKNILTNKIISYHRSKHRIKNHLKTHANS